MSFNSSPGLDSGELSLENDAQVAARLGGEIKPPTIMEEVKAAMVTGDPAAIKVASEAADAKYIIKPLDDAHVQARSEHLRQEGIQKDEELAEQKKNERIAAEAKIGTIFSARMGKGAVRYAPGGGVIETTPLNMKSEMVNKLIELYKQATTGEGQSLSGWAKYVEAVKNQAKLIPGEKERNAILRLVESGGSTGGELPAFIKGELTTEQYNQVLKSGIDRGMTVEESKTRADTISLVRKQQVQVAKELLAQIDPDLEYNM